MVGYRKINTERHKGEYEPEDTVTGRVDPGANIKTSKEPTNQSKYDSKL
jgi:hypothetical protein